MRTLETISGDFEDLNADKTLTRQQRNKKLIELMNELERDHGTMILNPTEDELKLPAVVLYRQVSQARK